MVQILGLLIAASLLGGVATDSAPHECTELMQVSGLCTDATLSDGGSAVDLWGSLTRPNGNDDASDPRSDDEPGLLPGQTLDCPQGAAECYVLTDPVRAEDIASFRPQSGSLAVEPAAFAIRGMPANLVASAEPHVVDGVLLGRPAQVRFVPVAFRFDHGDGTTARTSAEAASWNELGVDAFTETATSHVYRARGEYRLELRVVYAAEYRYDTGAWAPVIGQVTAAPVATTVTVKALVARLVRGDCAEYPDDPGC